MASYVHILSVLSFWACSAHVSNLQHSIYKNNGYRLALEETQSLLIPDPLARDPVDLIHAACILQSWANGRGPFTVGLMFWLGEKKLVGSYVFLSATSRS